MSNRSLSHSCTPTLFGRNKPEHSRTITHAIDLSKNIAKPCLFIYSSIRGINLAVLSSYCILNNCFKLRHPMLLLVGITWCRGRFVTRSTPTMRQLVDLLRSQMGRVWTIGVQICLVVVLLLLILAQRSTAQAADLTIRDTNQKSPTKPVDRSLKPTGKKDEQTAKHAPHSLIRKSQSSLSATLQQLPLNTSKSTSASTAVTTSSPNDTTTQSKDSSLSSKTGTMGSTSMAPLSLMSTAASTTTTTATPNSIAPRSSSTGTTTFAGATIAAPSTSPSGGGKALAKGRSMSRLENDMPGLSQLVNPPASASSPPSPAPAPPTISASPTSLSFTAQQGGSNPAAQTVSIRNTGGGTLSWTASDNAAWLTVSPSAGTGNGAVTLTATTGTLTAGSYSGTLTLSATGASPATVHVTFTVTAAPVPPALGASPTSLSFTAQQGGSNPAAQTVSIRNTGGGTLSWTASDNAAWLTVSPSAGTGNGAVTLSATTGTLTAGSYSGTLTLSATGAS